MTKSCSSKITFINRNVLAWCTIYNFFLISLIHACLYKIPVDCRGDKVFLFLLLLTHGGGSILPGLDRGASEDLSLQALKSDADLWKTKGTGRGTNMVLCRSEGRWVLLWLRSLSVVCLRRSLAFFPRVSGALRGKLGWFKNRSLAFRSGLGLCLFGGGHISFSIIFWDLGCRWVMRALVSVTCRWCNPSFFCFFFLWFLGSNLKLSEPKTDWMRLHANLSCSLVVPTLTQLDSIYSDSCSQIAAAPLCSTGGDLLWFSFWKNDSSRYAEKWINSPVANAL